MKRQEMIDKLEEEVNEISTSMFLGNGRVIMTVNIRT